MPLINYPFFFRVSKWKSAYTHVRTLLMINDTLTTHSHRTVLRPACTAIVETWSRAPCERGITRDTSTANVIPTKSRRKWERVRFDYEICDPAGSDFCRTVEIRSASHVARSNIRSHQVSKKKREKNKKKPVKRNGAVWERWHVISGIIKADTLVHHQHQTSGYAMVVHGCPKTPKTTSFLGVTQPPGVVQPLYSRGHN